MRKANPADCRYLSVALAGMVAMICLSRPAAAPAQSTFGVPVRVQFNFILNSSNNRPSSGEINTDAEVDAQVERANEILAGMSSELRIHSLGVQEVFNASQFYGSDTDDRDAIRNAAQADPDQFHWRSDAVNIYITSASDSAVSDFPPDNNIIILCQGIFDTTVMHELGHSLDLRHTHETCCGGDGCGDTILDDSGWDRDGISTNNYGDLYADLTSSQQANVDDVWWNLMSYHNKNNRYRITPCQLDRMSMTADSDRSWLLTRTPVYVNAAYAVWFQNGSFLFPFDSVQDAVDYGLDNQVLVLAPGTYTRPSGGVIATGTDILSRKGEAELQESKPDYDLPYALEESKDPRVREAVVRAQEADRRKQPEAVVAALLEASNYATGREKLAIQLELAQRYRDAGRLDEAALFFNRVATGADQPLLRKRMLDEAARMQVLKQKAEEKRSNPPGSQRVPDDDL